MKFSIRNLLGTILIVALVTFILRRPIKDAVLDDYFLFNLALPYYADLYILNLEHLWPWTISCEEYFDLYEKQHGHGWAFLISMSGGVSWLVSLILHVTAATAIWKLIKYWFFTERK